MNIFQLDIYAYDTALPQVRTTETITFTVNRNQFPPVFINTPYRYSISIDASSRGVVIGSTIEATDQDGVRKPICIKNTFFSLH